jgi:hypothetical protein
MKTREIDRDSYEYKEAACFYYWQKIETIAEEQGCSLADARKILHQSHEVPPVDEKDYKQTDPGNLIVLFMEGFEDWQDTPHNRDALFLMSSVSGSVSWYEEGKTDISLSEFIGNLHYFCRESLVDHLKVCDRLEDMKALLDDPIYGYSAKWELEWTETMANWDEVDRIRKSKFHPNVWKIQKIIEKGKPSIYSVFYPWVHPNHNVPNCMTVMADGGPIFRLEVMDTENLTQFRLVELMPPWWSMGGGIGESPEPGLGEYDFPFYDFNINDGDVIDLEKLLEVLQAGVEQINTRGFRKYGIQD